jgi:hypothetical protein
LSNEEFRNIAPHHFDFFRVGADHHAFLYKQRAGRRDFFVTIPDMFHNAEAACSHVGKTGNVAQMGNANTKFDSGVEDAGASWRLDLGSVNS